jgi:hypothetical protein
VSESPEVLKSFIVEADDAESVRTYASGTPDADVDRYGNHNGHESATLPPRAYTCTTMRYVFLRTASNTSLTLATSSPRLYGFGKV